jgi:hypothetical protein
LCGALDVALEAIEEFTAEPQRSAEQPINCGYEIEFRYQANEA